MVDLSNIVDIEKIRGEKEQLQGQRMLNARLSGWEEMSRHISSLEEGLIETQREMNQDSEYLNGQLEVLQMLKSFIANRVQLMSPGHPLVKEQVQIAAMM